MVGSYRWNKKKKASRLTKQRKINTNDVKSAHPTGRGPKQIEDEAMVNLTLFTFPP